MISSLKPMRQKIRSLLIQNKSISERYRRYASLSTPNQPETRGSTKHDSDLFNYTSGRWIYNEKARLAERHMVFDVEELKNAAARAMNKPETEVTSLKKLAEGGHNRTFEIAMRDGTSVLARLPYPSTSPQHLAVASDVATTEFVRAHGVPTPRILGYAVNDNPVGSDYILMEKLPGRPIGDAWFDLSKRQRLQVLHDIVEIESKLFSIPLPASGSIYYAQDLKPETPRVNIQRADAQFCVGPYAGRRWWTDRRGSLDIDRGPHVNTIRVLQSPAEKELAWLKKHGRPRYPFHRQHREIFKYEKENPGLHVRSLEAYLQMAPRLIPSSPELRSPILRHPDLQPNNIFVSEDYKVTGLIDWHNAIVLPTFLAAGIPNLFQNYNDAESRALTPPQPPAQLDSLDDNERTLAQGNFRRRNSHFFYVGFTNELNKRHARVLEEDMDILRRQSFDHAGEPWQGLNIPLEYDILQMVENWDKLDGLNDDGTVPPCPIGFDDKPAKRIQMLNDALREAECAMEEMNEMIGIGSDGWTSHERFESVKSKVAEMRKLLLGMACESPWLRDLRVQHWWYDDFDENQ